MKNLFILLQYLVPHHALTRLVGFFANCRNGFLKNLLIQRFIRVYGVDMDEAEHADPRDYASFNEFFTRALKPGARPVPEDAGSIVSPADGLIYTIGDILDDRLLQAKGRHYALEDLVGGPPERAAPFRGGKCATIYLSPRDYHRVHMPFSGTLKETIYIPGRLFSVNQTTAASIPNLFARNERLVSLFDTEAGPMAVVMVGAMIVAGIETTWAGNMAPQHRGISITDYRRYQPAVHLRKGEEMGRFKLGSTVIVLFGAGVMQWQDPVLLPPQSLIKMGQQIGTVQ